MQIPETEMKNTMFSINNLNFTNAITMKSQGTRKIVDNILQQSILSDTVNGELELGLKRNINHVLGTVVFFLICIQVYIIIHMIRRNSPTYLLFATFYILLQGILSILYLLSKQMSLNE